MVPAFDTRPIDKKIKVVNLNNGTEGTVQTTTLFTATYPCTVAGLRWSHGFRNSEASQPILFHWVLALIPDGNLFPDFDITDGADFFQPEQNVLAFGVVRTAMENTTNSPNCFVMEGNIKTKRKFKQGDSLVFGVMSTGGSGSNTFQWDSLVQFFLKS